MKKMTFSWFHHFHCSEENRTKIKKIEFLHSPVALFFLAPVPPGVVEGVWPFSGKKVGVNFNPWSKTNGQSVTYNKAESYWALGWLKMPKCWDFSNQHIQAADHNHKQSSETRKSKIRPTSTAPGLILLPRGLEHPQVPGELIFLPKLKIYVETLCW